MNGTIQLITAQLHSLTQQINETLIKPLKPPSQNQFDMTYYALSYKSLNTAVMILEQATIPQDLRTAYERLVRKIKQATKLRPEEEEEETELGGKDHITAFLNTRKPLEQSKDRGQIYKFLVSREQKEKDNQTFLANFNKIKTNISASQKVKKTQTSDEQTQTQIRWVKQLETSDKSLIYNLQLMNTKQHLSRYHNSQNKTPNKQDLLSKSMAIQNNNGKDNSFKIQQVIKSNKSKKGSSNQKSARKVMDNGKTEQQLLMQYQQENMISKKNIDNNKIKDTKSQKNKLIKQKGKKQKQQNVNKTTNNRKLNSVHSQQEIKKINNREHTSQSSNQVLLNKNLNKNFQQKHLLHDRNPDYERLELGTKQQQQGKISQMIGNSTYKNAQYSRHTADYQKNIKTDVNTNANESANKIGGIHRQGHQQYQIIYQELNQQSSMVGQARNRHTTKPIYSSTNNNSFRQQVYEHKKRSNTNSDQPVQPFRSNYSTNLNAGSSAVLQQISNSKLMKRTDSVSLNESRQVGRQNLPSISAHISSKPPNLQKFSKARPNKYLANSHHIHSSYQQSSQNADYNTSISYSQHNHNPQHSYHSDGVDATKGQQVLPEAIAAKYREIIAQGGSIDMSQVSQNDQRVINYMNSIKNCLNNISTTDNNTQEALSNNQYSIHESIYSHSPIGLNLIPSKMRSNSNMNINRHKKQIKINSCEKLWQGLSTFIEILFLSKNIQDIEQKNTKITHLYCWQQPHHQPSF